jgi:hypothetical protein
MVTVSTTFLHAVLERVLKLTVNSTELDVVVEKRKSASFLPGSIRWLRYLCRTETRRNETNIDDDHKPQSVSPSLPST